TAACVFAIPLRRKNRENASGQPAVPRGRRVPAPRLGFRTRTGRSPLPPAAAQGEQAADGEQAERRGLGDALDKLETVPSRVVVIVRQRLQTGDLPGGVRGQAAEQDIVAVLNESGQVGGGVRRRLRHAVDRESRVGVV